MEIRLSRRGVAIIVLLLALIMGICENPLDLDDSFAPTHASSGEGQR